MALRIENNTARGDVESEVLFGIADELGISRLKMLPLEVLWLIKHFSQTAILWRYVAVLSFANTIPNRSPMALQRIPISTVFAWQRGSLVEMANGPQMSAHERTIRACIDINGIKILERVATPSDTSTKHCREFIVEEEGKFNVVIGGLKVS